MSTTKRMPARPETQSEELDLAISTSDAANAAFVRPGMVYNKV